MSSTICAPSAGLPFLILCFLLLNSPMLVAPVLWPMLVLFDLIGLGIYAGFRWLLGRRPQLIAVCEHGLVGTAKGITVFTPWRDVLSLTAFRRGVHSGYDVNAGTVHYRLQRTMLGDELVARASELIAEHAELKWVHDNLAARPEALQTMADVLAR